jgi:hypothetical protein
MRQRLGLNLILFNGLEKGRIEESTQETLNKFSDNSVDRISGFEPRL